MINDLEKKLINNIQNEEDLQVCVKVVTDSNNPFFLQEYAITYNWDDGFEVPIAIADNINCDLGTALTLFWLAEGMCFFNGEVERNEYNNDWANFCEMLIERLTLDKYDLGPVSFKPEINKVTAYKYEKNGVPPVLYKEVMGL